MPQTITIAPVDPLPQWVVDYLRTLGLGCFPPTTQRYYVPKVYPVTTTALMLQAVWPSTVRGREEGHRTVSKLAEVLARLDEIKARAEHVRDEADYYPANCRKNEAALADDADALIAALEEARSKLYCDCGKPRLPGPCSGNCDRDE